MRGDRSQESVDISVLGGGDREMGIKPTSSQWVNICRSEEWGGLFSKDSSLPMMNWWGHFQQGMFITYMGLRGEYSARSAHYLCGAEGVAYSVKMFITYVWLRGGIFSKKCPLLMWRWGGIFSKECSLFMGGLGGHQYHEWCTCLPNV